MRGGPCIFSPMVEANIGQVAWKADWPEVRERYVCWWNRRGLVAHIGGLPAAMPHERLNEPAAFANPSERYINPSRWVEAEHYRIAAQAWPADTLPIAHYNTGPGSLSLFIGGEPGFGENTVWFEPVLKNVDSPESLPPLELHEDNRWWKLAVETVKLARSRAEGKYIVGMPELVENVGILAALRDPQTLMIDMYERPEWVERSVREINEAWKRAFDYFYEFIRLPDGSSAFAAFDVWGPGKTAKVQCDAAVLFSPEMFRRFVLPSLTDQCDWLDHSLFHLDGEECLRHLDDLLGIESLDAIEWTPKGVALGRGGGSPEWYDLYRRIKAAGKSVQILMVQPQELSPLLDAIGPDGVYILSDFDEPATAEKMLAELECWR